MMKHPQFFSVIVLLFTVSVSHAYIEKNSSRAKNTPKTSSASIACTNPTAQTDLDVNNVRCKILTAGDLWWDYSTQVGAYEIPKGSGKHSIYAGALWIGGIDQGGNLLLAGQEYGHSGGNNDFWPGPLDSNQAIDQAECNKYDKHFVITKKEVEDFVSGAGPMTPAIQDWPGNGNIAIGQLQYLAPFYDKNGNGWYEPDSGDYPGYDLVGTGCTSTNCIPDDKLYGDKTLWWVFNDNGNVHSNTGGNPIGLEVRAQAFGWATTDEINNMTFYDFRVINRSPVTQLDSCFLGIWFDTDLGNYQDDYIGCDVERGLGYTYNGDDNDDVGSAGYGHPPAVGIDFFRGPITNPTGVANDGKDNNRNCVVDEFCEQVIMSKFVSYTNGGGFPMQDPSNAVQYYNYLSGSWQDGSRWTYGAYGIGGNKYTDFFFPGNTDHQYEWGTGGNCQAPGAPNPEWSEASSGTVPGNRRMMASVGPFTMLPGAVNVVTFGVVWAQANSYNAQLAVNLLKSADTKAQSFFDNCFQMYNGPDAPDVTIQELDKKLILYLTNSSSSNNYKENYSERDHYITSGFDTVWTFQGYKIYQVKNKDVAASDLENVDKARLVGVYDKQDGVGQIVNYYIGVPPTPNYWTPSEMVNAPDSGVRHSVVITKDLFAADSSALVNHKTYYFMAVAYGYNPGEVAADPGNPVQGYNLPYLEGRRNIRAASAIPHMPYVESGGTEVNSDYGTGPIITRIEGNGNGGMTLDMSDASVSAILASADNRYETPTYKLGSGPVNVKIVDPLNVPPGHSYRLWFDTTGQGDSLGRANWFLQDLTTGEVNHSDQSIAVGYEQLFLTWGFSVNIQQIAYPGKKTSLNNGSLGASVTSNAWLMGLADTDSASYENWIRSGTASGSEFVKDYASVDDSSDYENLVGGTWAPYRVSACSDPSGFAANKYYTGPGFKLSFMSQANLRDLASVDVVFTSDKSKWSRCVVFEMCEDSIYASNTVSSVVSSRPRKHDFRRAPSVDKNGNPATVGSGASTNPNDANYISDVGMGWFPGYAINLETGERLNISFGENSALSGAYNQNGADMKWNPTSVKYDAVPWDTVSAPVFGGQHYIYVFGHNKDNDTMGSPPPNDFYNVPRYDSGDFIDSVLKLSNSLPSDAIKREIFRDAMWVNIPLLKSGASLLSSDVSVKLRVAKPYEVGYSSAYHQDAATIIYTDTAAVAFGQNKNLPMYEFSTDSVATYTGVKELFIDALDLINVVPNPYYGYSQYENDMTDRRVKITNLPELCTVSIYNLSGTLVRRFKKAEPNTNHVPVNSTDPASWHDGSLEWDLKNFDGFPVSSGVYIIHVEAKGFGEKVIKWFGTIRPTGIDPY